MVFRAGDRTMSDMYWLVWVVCGLALACTAGYAVLYTLLDRMTPEDRLKVSRLFLTAALTPVEDGDNDDDDNDEEEGSNKKKQQKPVKSESAAPVKETKSERKARLREVRLQKDRAMYRARIVEAQWLVISARMGHLDSTNESGDWTAAYGTCGRIALYDEHIYKSLGCQKEKHSALTPMALAPENRTRLERMGFCVTGDCMEAVLQFGSDTCIESSPSPISDARSLDLQL